MYIHSDLLCASNTLQFCNTKGGIVLKLDMTRVPRNQCRASSITLVTPKILHPARYGLYLGLCSWARFRGEAEAFADIAKLDDGVDTNVVHESHIFHSFIYLWILSFLSKRFRLNKEDAKWKGENEGGRIKGKHDKKDVKL